MSFGMFSRRGGPTVLLLLAALMPSACVRSPEAKSAAAMEAGKKLLEQKDAARAILQFRNAVQATPQNAEVYYQLGLAYLAAGDLENGVGGIRRALELNPKHAGAQLRLAQLMAISDDKGLLTDAQGRLEALLRDAPENPDALLALGVAELKLGDPAEALQHLQSAAAAAPQDLRYAVTLAQAKLQQKDPKGAEDALKKGYANSPETAATHLILGDFYVSQKRMAEAEGQVRRALEMEPKNGPALLALARLELTVGRKQEAEQHFKALSAFTGYQPVYGVFLTQEGRREEALREFERLVSMNPEDRQSRTNLVAAYESANRWADATKVLNGALKKNPKDLEALLERGRVFIRATEYAQAEADLNQVLKMKPDEPQVHYFLAKLSQARGQNLIYRQELSEALRLSPYLLRIRLEAAQELIQNNSSQAALELLDQAPESQARSVAILVQRNWALWALGKMADMRKGIDLGLSQGKSTDLLIQDGLWKLKANDASSARAALEEALDIDPTDLRALEALRRTYIAKKQGPLALQKVKEYAARQPKSAPVQEFLGTMLMGNGDRAQARVAFEAAKAADPKFVKADFSLIQTDIADGKMDDAQRRLQSVLSSDGANAVARLWLAHILATKGENKAAIEQYRQVVGADASNAQALNNLAYLLAESGGETSEALKFAQKAQELAPNEAEYKDTLGWILYRKGLYPLAVAELERAASKDDSAIRYYHLAMAYAKTGDLTRGRATLKAALSRNPKLPEARVAQEMLGQSSH